jgi:hypothetical protein
MEKEYRKERRYQISGLIKFYTDHLTWEKEENAKIDHERMFSRISLQLGDFEINYDGKVELIEGSIKDIGSALIGPRGEIQDCECDICRENKERS